MKVILVQPPIEDFYDTDIRLQPVGLASLKAAIIRDLPFVEGLPRRSLDELSVLFEH